MQNEIVTIEKAANRLSLRCERWSQPDIESAAKDVLPGGPLSKLGALYAAATIVLEEAPDLARRLAELVDQGKLHACNPGHGGIVRLNGRPAHKGTFVSLAEAEHALTEHERVFFADPPAHDEGMGSTDQQSTPDDLTEPGSAADQVADQEAAEDERAENDAQTTVAEKKKGITKQQVMNAFEGMRFSRDRWGKNLASPPNWLKECRVARGNIKTSALWNPVLIASALLDKNISLKKLDAVFIGLNDWAAEWSEVSATFR